MIIIKFFKKELSNNKLATQEKIKIFRKFQEYTTGTTFEPKKCTKEVKLTMAELDMMNKQATVNTCYHMNS